MDGGKSNWILDLIRESSYLGVGLLMFAETLFPPVPSEVVMPVAGFLAGDGRMSIVGAIAAGTAGSLAGAYAWFLIARRIGADRLKRWARKHGRWLTLSPRDIDRVMKWFTRRGHWAVMVGRLLPAVRTLISIPAGISEMRTSTFLLWSALGTVLWSGALAMIGYSLGERYEQVAPWIGRFSNVFIAGALLWYGYRVVRFKA